MGANEVLAESRQQEVRDELGHVLESAPFRGSKRCREFLQHIVEKTVSGQSGSLKERTIGVELFGLPHDFDTSQHTIVRVTASETRKKLAQYYHSESDRQHGVRIDLPPGSYSVEFTWAEAPAAISLADAPSAKAPETPKNLSRRWLIAAGSAGVAVTGFSVWRWRSSKANGALASATLARDLSARPDIQSAPLRISAGSTNSYLDRNGQVWGVDRFSSGGFVQFRSSERIFRTLDPDLYRRVRLGEFRYDIPLASGSYEMHLHFAETGLSDFISAESSGEGQRVFRVSANNQTILDFFDVVADAAGANIADERVFRGISPSSDGRLHLSFSPLRGSAMVSAIELLLVDSGKSLPLLVRSGWPTSWRDSSGRQWRADSYFLGGNALVRRTNPARESESTAPDNALYASERWGHFSYALPVAEGKYRVTLKFCEGHLGPRNTGVGGVGSRVFDVYCNGRALLNEFDILRQAGGESRPLDQIFSGIRPNAQGKILLTFVPIKGMACVNGIEVVEQ